MADDSQANQPGPATSKTGYTPAPVSKTRTVTGSHSAVGEEPPFGFEQNARSPKSVVSPNPQNTSDVARPSIQINLNTINQTTQSIVEQEEEESRKLAEFSPLSSTPPAYQTAKGNDPQPWNEYQAIPEALTPPPQTAYNPSDASDIYKGRRRSLLVLTLIVAVFAWFIAMATQVGMTRLLSDPYGETIKTINGPSLDSEELDKLRQPGVQTTVVINEGSAVANVLSVNPLSKRLFVVQGVVLNESAHRLETVLLRMSLRSPEESDTPWIQRLEFGCCEYLSPESISAADPKELETQSEAQKTMNSTVNLAEGRSQKFTMIISLKKGHRLKRDQLQGLM